MIRSVAGRTAALPIRAAVLLLLLRAPSEFRGPVFSPEDRVGVGLELIQGSRKNRDGSKGEATQVQLVTLIPF